MPAKLCPHQHKICYPTKRAAIRAALNYSRKRGTPLRVYLHKACSSYHLTHKERFQGVAS